MRFSNIFLAAVAAVVAAAQNSPSQGKPNAFNSPASNYLLRAGGSQEFTWSNKAGSTVTIRLRSGANGNLDQGVVIADSIPNDGKFTYNVPSSIVEGADYALEITNDDDPTETNYTQQFVIQSPNKAGSTASSSGSSASASRTSSSAAASSSSSASESSSSASESDSSSSTSSSAASSTSSESSSETSDAAATTSQAAESATPTTGAAPVVRVGGSLFAVAAGFALAL